MIGLCVRLAANAKYSMISGDAVEQLNRNAVALEWLERLADRIDAGGHTQVLGGSCARSLDGFIQRTRQHALLEAALNCLHT